MPESISRFLTSNWGNLASVIGLIVSAVSAIFARRASTAAMEAREAVLRRNVADDMAQARGLATDICTLVDAGKFESAIPFCSQLQNLTVYIQQRWQGKLEDSSRKKCAGAATQLEGIHKVLGKFSRNSGSINAAAVERLVTSCRGVKLVFVEEEAIAIRTLDGGGNAG